jgi:hypothetical protein
MLQYNQLKQRNRSRSGSSLASVGGQQRQHPPPLVSHASDPSLATSLSLITSNPPPPSTTTSTFQPLLAQLLTSKYTKFIVAYSLWTETRVPACLSCECLSTRLPKTSTGVMRIFFTSILRADKILMSCHCFHCYPVIFCLPQYATYSMQRVYISSKTSLFIKCCLKFSN